MTNEEYAADYWAWVESELDSWFDDGPSEDVDDTIG